MNYDLESICKKDTTKLGVFRLYEEHGTGVMEDPNYDGRTVREYTGTEFEAFVVSAAMNIDRHGSMLTRSSWESPNVRYKLIKWLEE